jgi:hypothetical protein
MNNQTIYNRDLNDRIAIQVSTIRTQINYFPIYTGTPQLNMAAGDDGAVKNDVVISRATNPNHQFVFKGPASDGYRLQWM